MNLKHCIGLLACFITMSVMIIVTARISYTPQAKNTFTHLFDWAFIYHMGMAMCALFYLRRQIQGNHNPGQEYNQLIDKTHIGDNIKLQVPYIIWAKICLLEYSTSLFLILSLVILSPFLFVAVDIINMIVCYLYVHHVHSLQFKKGSTMYGVGLIVTGQMMAGISGISEKSQTEEDIEIIIGFIIMIIQFGLQSYYMIEKKKFLTQYSIVPLKFQSIVGINTLILWAIGLAVLQYIPCYGQKEASNLCVLTSDPTKDQRFLEQTQLFFTHIFTISGQLYGLFTLILVFLLAIPASLLDSLICLDPNPIRRHGLFNIFIVFMVPFYLIANPPTHIIQLLPIIIGLIIEIIGLTFIFNLYKIDEEDLIPQQDGGINNEDESEVS